MIVQETLKKIRPVSENWLEKARERLDSLTKPRGSLGMLEDLAARFAAIRGEIPIGLPAKEVIVFAGDHDVVSEGVSAYPQEVTKLMVRNFLNGGAAINVLARCAGAEISIVDIGMKEELFDAPALIARNVRRGAGNIARGPAMTLEEAEKAVSTGIDMAESARKRGVGMIATGEMGIGNTTPSSALFASLLSLSPEEVTGRGTGLDDKGLIHKMKIIERVLEVNHDRLGEPMSALAAVGGLEIAGICGLCLGGAANQMAVVV
ncbi:MAG: nicotinate-nucleotide--dimethylbenzimidazole phosphoribosyltransferase, partial [Pseudomonadota bacterium]